MNFGTLKTRIQSLIGRAPNEVCYELVTADINQELRLHVMESTITLVEAASVALPSDFLEVVSLYRDTDPRTTLNLVTPQQLQRLHSGSSALPAHYAIVDGAILLQPTPSGSENLKLRYYQKLSDLAADSDENDVLTTYPSVYVYGALTHHAALIRDTEALGAWAQAYDMAKRQARRDDKKYRFGGATPVVTPRSVA